MRAHRRTREGDTYITLKGWNYWSLIFTAIHAVPINFTKPWMRLDISCSSLKVSKTFTWVDLTEFGNYVASFGRHSGWVMDFSLDNPKTC